VRCRPDSTFRHRDLRSLVESSRWAADHHPAAAHPACATACPAPPEGRALPWWMSSCWSGARPPEMSSIILDASATLAVIHQNRVAQTFASQKVCGLCQPRTAEFENHELCATQLKSFDTMIPPVLLDELDEKHRGKLEVSAEDCLGDTRADCEYRASGGGACRSRNTQTPRCFCMHRL
jgi:hypothetical protein